ncbi:MAG: hypothetical protein LAO76_26300 [Acidobacteriia bacterium]|nr:hypothetical protein [Terriglobia bacterium]
MKAFVLGLALVLIGCGGGPSTVHAAPLPSATPSPSPAATPAPTPTPTPIPATVPSGSLTPIDVSAGNVTLTLEPGEYGCPASIPSGTRIIGHGTIVPPELTNDKAFAPMSAAAAAPVRIFCDHDLVISSVSGVEISGVIFYFENLGGMVLDSITGCQFSIGIADSPLAMNLESTTGNAMENTFPRLIIYNVGKGIILQGFNSTGVTWDDFGHVEIVRARDYGINISRFSDTNKFDHVLIRLANSAQAGVIFNDAAALADVDASGNVFSFLSCDVDSSTTYTGYCADFRGYTVGNHILMGFGIMPDANKVHFQNAFSQQANIVVKIQESPKIP